MAIGSLALSIGLFLRRQIHHAGEYMVHSRSDAPKSVRPLLATSTSPAVSFLSGMNLSLILYTAWVDMSISCWRHYMMLNPIC